VLHLPRFEFAFDAGLKPALEAMRMVDAFYPESADFSGMVDGRPPEPLWMDDVLHKAFIGVHENGTEAAAATAIPMPGAGPVTPPPPIEIRIDRPFLFAIRDTVTRTILFLGRVLDPTA
jgi:serpin B